MNKATIILKMISTIFYIMFFVANIYFCWSEIKDPIFLIQRAIDENKKVTFSSIFIENLSSFLKYL